LVEVHKTNVGKSVAHFNDKQYCIQSKTQHVFYTFKNR